MVTLPVAPSGTVTVMVSVCPYVMLVGTTVISLDALVTSNSPVIVLAV